MTVSAIAGGTVFANNTAYPTGRYLNAVQVAALLVDGFGVVLDQTIAPEYRGRFRGFLRCFLGGATGVGDLGVRFSVYSKSSSGLVLYQTETINNVALSYVIYDFGVFTIPPNYGAGQVFDQLVLKVEYINRAGAGFQCDFIDLVIWPVDEFAGDYYHDYASRINNIGFDNTDNLTELNVDSVRNPKRTNQALADQVVTRIEHGVMDQFVHFHPIRLAARALVEPVQRAALLVTLRAHPRRIHRPQFKRTHHAARYHPNEHIPGHAMPAEVFQVEAERRLIGIRPNVDQVVEGLGARAFSGNHLIPAPRHDLPWPHAYDLHRNVNRRSKERIAAVVVGHRLRDFGRIAHCAGDVPLEGLECETVSGED